MEKKMKTLDKLRALMGYVENGTEQTLSIFQDDATGTYHIKAKNMGKEIWSEWHNTFEGVIEISYAKHAEKFEDD